MLNNHKENNNTKRPNANDKSANKNNETKNIDKAAKDNRARLSSGTFAAYDIKKDNSSLNDKLIIKKEGMENKENGIYGKIVTIKVENNHMNANYNNINKNYNKDPVLVDNNNINRISDNNNNSNNKNSDDINNLNEKQYAKLNNKNSFNANSTNNLESIYNSESLNTHFNRANQSRNNSCSQINPIPNSNSNGQIQYSSIDSIFAADSDIDNNFFFEEPVNTPYGNGFFIESYAYADIKFAKVKFLFGLGYIR